MQQLLRRLWYLFRRRQLERDLSEELEFHREMKQREFEQSGGTIEEAAVATRRALGSVTLTQDQVRDVWIRPGLDAFLRDLVFGARLLQKNPGFATIAILILAVSIGANTAVFTLVDHLLLRPLPYAEPDRLATVVRHYARGTTSGEGYAQNGATWFALREGVSGLDWASTGSAGGVNLVAGDQVAYVKQHKVSAGLFRVLGVPPALGREFTADEDREGGPAVAVLSHQLWARMFGGDVQIVGQSITLRGERFTVVGVMPASFHPLTPADLWTPLRPSRQGEGNGQNYLFLARLRPGVRWADASGQVESIGSALLQDMFKPPPDLRLSMHLVPFRQSVTSNIREPLLVLWAAVGVLLLIGCVNIAALLIVRASVRAPEIATRIALGGGRATIVRQLLAESVVLAAGGGLVGIGLG